MRIAKNNSLNFDWFVLIITIGLMLFSIAVVYSASAFIAQTRFNDYDKLFWNHISKIIIGIIILIIFINVDYHKLERFSKLIMFVSLVPLFLVFIVGSPINGAYRWIHFVGLNFQPSEFAKFALVLHFSTLLKQRREVIQDFKLGILPLLVWAFIVCGMIAIQPNFSSATVIYIIALAMLYIGNARTKYLMYIISISLSTIVIYAVSAPYRLQRLINYFNINSNNADLSDAAFQSQQAIIAFGNGGFVGLGPAQSRQSLLYLPESYGDFIFSIIGEEYGFIGTSLIIILFLIIAWRGIKIARFAPDLFGYYLSFGIVFTFTIYAFVSAGVNCGLLPTTGLPMPFISYGGSAIFFYCAAMGILLNISKQAKLNSNSQNKISFKNFKS